MAGAALGWCGLGRGGIRVATYDHGSRVPMPPWVLQLEAETRGEGRDSGVGTG